MICAFIQYFACGANTYIVSKYAQKGLAELLKAELRPWNINVQVVIPGYTETQMLDEGERNKRNKSMGSQAANAFHEPVLYNTSKPSSFQLDSRPL